MKEDQSILEDLEKAWEEEMALETAIRPRWMYP